MKNFINPDFKAEICRTELNEFKTMLSTGTKLEERRDILPFFRQRQHLSTYIGAYVTDILYFDRIAYEYELYGDFSVDLVVGDSKRKRYLFVEFETGTNTGMFRKKGKKDTLEWSPAFEHGFSQIVDWFWILDDMRNTGHFRNKFGSNQVRIWAMLVAGRDSILQEREKLRLRWREEKVLINSNSIFCLTYDALCQDLDERMEFESVHWAST